MTSVLYLAIDLYSIGGIQRYSSAQINVLRELVGEKSVSVFVLRPQPEGDRFFELPFEVDYTGKFGKISNRLRFIQETIQYCLHNKPEIIWINHVKLFPLTFFASTLYKNTFSIGNVYGWEVWSGLSTFEKSAIRRMSHIVSDSHFTANYMHEAFAIPSDRTTVIWDPVDVDRFVPRQTAARVLPSYGIPYRSDACYLMTLGRVSMKSRHKGYDRMLNIMGSIKRKDVIYIIVGDGDDRARLEKRVVDEGLSECVYFLGSVPESDLVDVYNAADIFVLVSDRGYGRGEGVPLTPLEAASCGKPIIVGDEDGSAEAVEHGKNGYIVSPRNLSSITDAILHLVDNPELRQSMGIAARRRVETHFSYEMFKRRTTVVLDSIVNM